MDQQIIQVLGSMPPEQRLSFALQQGIPEHILAKLEDVAEQMGFPLTGGRATSSGGEGDEDAAQQESTLPEASTVEVGKAGGYGE